MKSHPIAYPVIMLNKGGFGAFSSPEKLQVCGEEGVDTGYMTGAKIIDVNGKQFVVKNTIKIKNLNFLPSFLVSYNKRISKVEFELSETGRLSLCELKSLLIDMIKNDEKIKSDETFRIQCIKGSKTYYEIIECVGIF